jgi:hypothetical protein
MWLYGQPGYDVFCRTKRSNILRIKGGKEVRKRQRHGFNRTQKKVKIIKLFKPDPDVFPEIIFLFLPGRKKALSSELKLLCT